MYQYWKCFGDDRFSPLDKLLFIVICSNQDFCNKSLNTLSEITGMNKKSVINSIKNLEKMGAIVVKRSSTSTLLITPTIPKNGPSEKSTIPKNGTALYPKTDQNYTQKRYPNSNRTITEQDDLKIESGDTAELAARLGLNIKELPISRKEV